MNLAFGCRAVANFIPNSVTHTGNHAFGNCSCLVLTFVDTTKSERNALQGCRQIAKECTCSCCEHSWFGDGWVCPQWPAMNHIKSPLQATDLRRTDEFRPAEKESTRLANDRVLGFCTSRPQGHSQEPHPGGPCFSWPGTNQSPSKDATNGAFWASLLGTRSYVRGSWPYY